MSPKLAHLRLYANHKPTQKSCSYLGTLPSFGLIVQPLAPSLRIGIRLTQPCYMMCAVLVTDNDHCRDVNVHLFFLLAMDRRSRRGSLAGQSAGQAGCPRRSRAFQASQFVCNSLAAHERLYRSRMADGTPQYRKTLAFIWMRWTPVVRPCVEADVDAQGEWRPQGPRKTSEGASRVLAPESCQEVSCVTCFFERRSCEPAISELRRRVPLLRELREAC